MQSYLVWHGFLDWLRTKVFGMVRILGEGALCYLGSTWTHTGYCLAFRSLNQMGHKGAKLTQSEKTLPG